MEAGYGRRDEAGLPDAKTVLSLLPTWFHDYNENGPHKEQLRARMAVSTATVRIDARSMSTDSARRDESPSCASLEE